VEGRDFMTEEISRKREKMLRALKDSTNKMVVSKDQPLVWVNTVSSLK